MAPSRAGGQPARRPRRYQPSGGDPLGLGGRRRCSCGACAGASTLAYRPHGAHPSVAAAAGSLVSRGGWKFKGWGRGPGVRGPVAGRRRVRSHSRLASGQDRKGALMPLMVRVIRLLKGCPVLRPAGQANLRWQVPLPPRHRASPASGGGRQKGSGPIEPAEARTIAAWTRSGSCPPKASPAKDAR